ncbi:TPA: phage DNA encapsidation protein [Enterococcus faecium]|nr:phage DNA encapsidation protein [Enterococcus faecium]
MTNNLGVKLKEKNLYYSPNNALGFNCLMLFVIGARGIGKTYGYKKFVVNRFIKHGEQFIYLRRFKTELKKIPQFFKTMAKEFPEHKLEVKGKEFYCDDKLMGWAVPLSTWGIEKSNEYPDVRTILFDEFLIEKSKITYLPNEAEALLNMMETVFRDRTNTRCILLSNATSVVNPYFLYFNLQPDLNKRFNLYQDRGILIELCDSKDFAEVKKQTPFGRLIRGTDYEDFSINNEFVNDSDTFIEKRSKNSSFLCAIAFEGKIFGYWIDAETGCVYVSYDYQPNTNHFYAMTTKDHEENRLLMKNWRNNYYLSTVAKAFKNSYLRFDNIVIKNLHYDLFNKMKIW